MAIEKRFLAIPLQLFTANGTTDGLITIPDASNFKVKQHVYLSANTLPNLDHIEVKRVISKTQLYVGPRGGNIDARVDISAYTVALAAGITANEQKRSEVSVDSIARAVFEEEPTVAIRVMPVDKLGNDYDAANPLPIAFDGTIEIGSVEIKDQDGDILQVNSDGSINVNVVSSPSASPGLQVSHQEITAVASGAETTLITMVAPPAGFKAYRIDVMGENIALYRVKVNNVTVHNKRTFFGNSLNESFIFEPFENGLELNGGDQLKVTVLHNRPMVGNFEVTVMGLNL